MWSEGVRGHIGYDPQVGLCGLIQQGLFCGTQDDPQFVGAVYRRDELVWDERVFSALVESLLEIFVLVDTPLQVAFVGRLALDEI